MKVQIVSVSITTFSKVIRSRKVHEGPQDQQSGFSIEVYIANGTATYNNARRLQTLANGSSTEMSIYNALGQRIEISGGVNGTVLYAYDETGHVLGEYDGTGALIEETVWLGDIPVATLRPNGATVSIYYIHSDELNTPRQITRPSDNTAMWSWNADPFGAHAPAPCVTVRAP